MGFLDALPIRVTDAVGSNVAAVVGQAAAQGPGFTLDRAEAKAMLDQSKQVLADLVKLQQEADQLAQIQPPARDQVTMGYHGNLTTQQNGQPAAFAYGAGHVQMEINYLAELISRLEDALGIVHSTEENNHGAVQAAGQGHSSGGYLNGPS